MSRGRYAPSPTGSLHLGNARTALVAWLRARKAGSSFVLRVEDLDEPRTVPAAVEGNAHELRWLGLDWDEGPDVGGPFAPYRQSGRHHIYRKELSRLQGGDRLFECYLSRRELRELSSAPHGAAPVYGERERERNRRLTGRKRAQGKEPAIRLRVHPGRVSFRDALSGEHAFDVEGDVGDIVLTRADGAWAYQFAVVVDDIAMRIEEVVRGDDLLSSTAAQLVIYEALGARPPTFVHVPLLLDAKGERLAKRKGSLTLGELQSAGARPERVTGLLAFTLGLLREPLPVSPRDLLSGFDLSRIHKEPFRLEEAHLEWLAKG